MLVILTSLSSAHADTALDAVAISLAFEQKVDVVLLTSVSGNTESTQTENIIERLGSVASLGLSSFYVLDDDNRAMSHQRIPMQPINSGEFRRLCDAHTMTLSF